VSVRTFKVAERPSSGVQENNPRYRMAGETFPFRMSVVSEAFRIPALKEERSGLWYEAESLFSSTRPPPYNAKPKTKNRFITP
jgi:hypothetical protein